MERRVTGHYNFRKKGNGILKMTIQFTDDLRKVYIQRIINLITDKRSQ